MRIDRALILVFLLGESHLWAQNSSTPSAQTTPTPAPTEKSPSITAGLLTPEAILPEGFTFRADQIDLSKLLEGNELELDAKGNIKVKTNHGDTLSAKKARLDFAENSSSVASLFDDVELRSLSGIEVFADKAEIQESNESIVFTGNVSAYQGTALHRGESVTYFYETRQLKTNNLRTSFGPILLESGSFEVIENENGKYYQGRNAGVTTQDVAEPSFWLRGDEITILPDERIRFRNLKLYAGGRPIFWLPKLTQKFDGKLNYRPTPGFRSNLGVFLLNEYTTEFGGKRDVETGLRTGPTHEIVWHGDLFSQRGVGLGVDVNSYAQKDNPNLGWISAYHIFDNDPTETRSGESRGDFDDTQRFRLQARKRAEANWLPGARGHLDLNVTLLSDRFFLEDFRTRDTSSDFQPDNTLALSQSWNESNLLTVWTRFRVNDFYQSDQRLPEIAFDQTRRHIFDSPFLHEGQTSIGIYREELDGDREDDLRAEQAATSTTATRLEEIDSLLSDTGFARFHTYQEISLPLKLNSGLRLTPRIGAGNTSYQEVQGTSASQSRNLFHASVDASLKFTKRYPDWISKKWGLDSALHVITPYATATVVETEDLDPLINPIDRLTASTRPRALTPGRFGAIDDLTDFKILRLGTRNRILTQRNGSSHQWLSIDTYVDIFADDPEFSRDISNLYTDLHWSPLPWLDLTVETQVPLFSASNFTEVATGIDFQPNADTDLSIKHRFLQDHPILEDSNRLEINAYHRINEEWGIGAVQRWEFEDNSLEFQQYSLHRNLGGWIFTMGLFSRDNSSEEFEFGALFGFSLTEFPSISLPLRVDN